MTTTINYQLSEERLHFYLHDLIQNGIELALTPQLMIDIMQYSMHENIVELSSFCSKYLNTLCNDDEFNLVIDDIEV